MTFVDDEQMGNAVINDPTDQPGLIDYAWTHAIISDQLHRNIYKDCDFKSNISTSQCTMHIRGFLEAYSGIDIYNIYAPVCLSSLNKAAQKLIVAPRFFTQQVSICLHLYISVLKLQYLQRKQV